MNRAFTLIVLGVLFFTLTSHELFLKTDSYFLKQNSQAELYLYNGTFDKSENVITRDRVIEPKIVGPNYSFVPVAGDYHDKGDVTYLKFKTGAPGTYVAGISTKSKGIELNGEEFTAYLEHEGLTDVIAERKQKGISDKTAHEKYAKHVKAILQVANKRSDDFASALNYPVEFIPLSNPYDVKVGQDITFKLLYLGKPLANQTVHVSSRKSPDVKEGAETSLRTNGQGEVSFTIDNGGQWYIATIHMQESEEANYDYESNWATLTFEVRSR